MEAVNYNGLVSIIVPSYNRFDLLCHCIHSMLMQTYENIEIIVVNDCSTDPRYQNGKLETFPKTTVIHLPINQRVKYGIPAAQGQVRNEGLRVAKGEWIAFCDDDDFFNPSKLEIQLADLKENSMFFSCSNMENVAHNVISEAELNVRSAGPHINEFMPRVLKLQDIATANKIKNSTVLMHHSIVKLAGEQVRAKFEDYEYWKTALQYCDALYIDQILVRYSINSPKFYVC